MQFLYADGTDAHFMDNESFEQIAIPQDAIAERAALDVKPNDEVDMLFIDGEPGDIQLPASVELEVTETEPGAARRHRVAAAATSPPTLETGAIVQVPLFVNIGDRVKVDTRSRRVHVARLGRRSGRASRCPAAPTSAAAPSSRSTSTRSPAASSTTSSSATRPMFTRVARLRGARTERDELDDVIARLREGLDDRAHRAARDGKIMRVALLEMLHPTPTGDADPAARARSTRRSRLAKRFCGGRRARVRQRHPRRRRCASWRRERRRAS